MNITLLILSLLFSKVSMSQNFKIPTKDELKKTLTQEQYNCTQEEGTEPPFKNKYWNNIANY